MWKMILQIVMLGIPSIITAISTAIRKKRQQEYAYQLDEDDVIISDGECVKYEKKDG
jgi:hypothetical protein